MHKDIHDYVEKCMVCQKVKYDRGMAASLLQPLPIPDAPWESISMDFIFGLLRTQRNKYNILLIEKNGSLYCHTGDS